MSTRTSRKPPKRDKWDEPTGPLTDDEMTDWGRRIQIRHMIEGRIIGDTDARAWLELRAYKKMPRVFVNVRKHGVLSVTDKEGTRPFDTGQPTLVALGFRPEAGMQYILLGADITPQKQLKPKRSKKNGTRTRHPGSHRKEPLRRSGRHPQEAPRAGRGGRPQGR